MNLSIGFRKNILFSIIKIMKIKNNDNILDLKCQNKQQMHFEIISRRATEACLKKNRAHVSKRMESGGSRVKQ